MANKYNLREIGVIYLDEVPQGSFPTAQPFTGILGWDGANLVIKSDNQGPVYTAVPSYNIAQQSLEVYDPNNTVVIPTYSVATGEYLIRDSAGNDFTPRVSVIAQNISIYGDANPQTSGVVVGGIYLAANTTIGLSSEAYMSGTSQGGKLVLRDFSQGPETRYAEWNLNPTSSNLSVYSSVSCTILTPPGATVPVDGWYQLLLEPTGQSQVRVIGLRLVVT